MAVQAYVIIECSVDPADVVPEVARIEGVRQVHALFGDLEVIAYVEADDLRGLDDVISSLYDVEGVEATETHVAREM
jgi:translation elongation factor EF-1beta